MEPTQVTLKQLRDETRAIFKLFVENINALVEKTDGLEDEDDKEALLIFVGKQMMDLGDAF